MRKKKHQEDYVIATGETHSVGEFAQLAFETVGLNWRDYVISDKKLHRPLDVHQLCGNHNKAQRILGWKPKVTFKELVKLMVETDLKLWQKHLAGEPFPWDAPNHSSEMDIVARNVTKDANREARAFKVKMKLF